MSSQLKTTAGSWKFKWQSIPKGIEGVVQAQLESGQCLDVRWRRDAQGIWVELPHGVFGFDLKRETDETGAVKFTVSERGNSSHWSEVQVFHGDQALQSTSRSARSKSTRVRAQMPGKIIRLMVELGQTVEKDQPVLVMEAMKMENEIRAPQAGRISQVKVVVNQAVETGADLLLIEPQN